ncbi:MAG: hypothetical protein M1812_006467 [Candelaria pacifica]|nr:MAG: hypothetical protein M1812_006467 [Candelaria pacifica]
MAAPGSSSMNEGGSSFKIARGSKTFKCADYNVAWVCALRDPELLAARVLLDEEHITPPYDTQYDRNTYICGQVNEHKVVVACLPSGRTGNVNAGHLTGPMFHTFPNIKITLLVGIGGGVPLQSPQNQLEDIYLADVVLGWPGDGKSAVVQYDPGRWKVDGFEQRGLVDQPDWHLTQALEIVISNYEVGQTDFQDSVARLQKIPRFNSPSSDEDRLFQATYKHEGDYYTGCSRCLAENLVQRPERAKARPDGSFKFHCGTIASGGAVIQDGELRDRLSKECNNARCFEMEAVGVNLNSRCLVIRGVADYADSHKNDMWKCAAAGNAAAFAKEFLLTIRASGLRELSGIAAVRTPISTLPGTLSIDPDFVGRDDVLGQIDERFGKSRRVALVGLGGIGKTEIAVHYCHRYRERTPECHIFWVYGATRRSFDEAYRRIAKELEIPGCENPGFQHRKEVRRVLEQKGTAPWIMIVDNADDYDIYFPPPNGALGENEQSEYLACCLPYETDKGGRLIVTTSNARVGEDITSSWSTIQTLELAPVDAKKLLQSKIPAGKWEDEAGDRLLRELDYIPLAITQAAAFIRRNKLISLKYYLGKLSPFHPDVADVLSKELHDARRQPGTPSAIFRTWQMSYQQIVKDDPEAARKLCLMAVLDNQAIPRMLVARGDELETAEVDAVQLLLDFSLIKGDEHFQFFSMHPLQQLVNYFHSQTHVCVDASDPQGVSGTMMSQSTQNWLRLENSRLEEWQEYGLVLLSERMPCFNPTEKEPGKRATCSILLPHATIAVSYESKRADCRIILLMKMSAYESDLGRYLESYQHAAQSLHDSMILAETTVQDPLRLPDLGLEAVGDSLTFDLSPGEEVAAFRSGFKLFERGDNDAAFANFQRSLDLYQELSDSINVVLCLGMQAKIMWSMKKYKEAENLYRQALQKSITIYGENHEFVCSCMDTLGRYLRKRGKTAEAVQYHRLALRGWEDIYGLHHPRTMECIGLLTMSLWSDGNSDELDEARILHGRMLRYREHSAGSYMLDRVIEEMINYLKLEKAKQSELPSGSASNWFCRSTTEAAVSGTFCAHDSAYDSHSACSDQAYSSSNASSTSSKACFAAATPQASRDATTL